MSKKILAQGSLLRIATFFINVIISFALMPFIIHGLGDRAYGLWVFVGSVVGYYWLFDFGLGSAVQRYVSRAIGTKDYREANVFINTSLVLFSIISLVIIVVSVMVAYTFPFLLKKIAAETTLFRYLVLISGLSMALNFPMRVFSGVLVSHLRYDIETIISITKICIRALLIVLFLHAGGIIALAIVTFFADCLEYGLTFFVARRIAPYTVFSRSLIDTTKIRTIFSYSVYTFLNKIADKLRFQIDNFVIAAFIGLGPITMFSIAARLVQYFFEFMISAVGIVTPLFSQYEAKGDYDAIREKMVFMTKCSGYLSLLIAGMLIIFGQAFIVRWMGRDYSYAYIILLVLIIPLALDLMQSPSIQVLYGISKHKFFAYANSLEGIANLILSIVLVKKYGILGVALGTAIPMLITKIFIQPIYVCSIIHFSVVRYYFKVLVPVLLKSVTILFILWWFVKDFIAPDYGNLLLLGAGCCCIFTTITFFIGLSSQEQQYFKKIIHWGRA